MSVLANILANLDKYKATTTPTGPSIGAGGSTTGGGTPNIFGGTGGNRGGITIPTNLFPHSYSGLPAWAVPYAKGLASWISGLYPAYGQTLTNLSQLPTVAQNFLTQGQQALSSAINRQTQQSLKEALQNLASIGATSSYAAQKAFENIGREALQRTQEGNAALASNYMKMLFSGLLGAPSAYQGAVGLLPSLLGAGRTYTQEDPLAPYKLLVTLLGLY